MGKYIVATLSAGVFPAIIHFGGDWSAMSVFDKGLAVAITCGVWALFVAVLGSHQHDANKRGKGDRT